MTAHDKSNARRMAAQCVRQWLTERPHADVLLRDADLHHAVIMEIVYGVIRRRRTLDWLIGHMTRRKPSAGVAALLMTGLYQLLWMNEPDYAVVDETVHIAHDLCGRPQAGMVNAVLRRLVRERAQWTEAVADASLGVRESHPDLLVRRWKKHFGEASAMRMMQWNNTPADVTVRRLTGRVTHEDFLSRHEPLAPHPFRPERYYTVPRGRRVEALDGFADGDFIVQDPSTAPAVEALDTRPGESVWDACAAPGGKTIALADAMRNRGRLVATDRDADRLKRLRENVRRTGCDIIDISILDAVKNVQRQAPFDAVLLDVPCTNTGVLRRRPDARWRFDEKTLKQTVRLQYRLLDHGAAAVRPGGRLVYSTCSVEPEENHDLIADWLQHHPAFTLDREIQLLPGEHGTDGAYAARLNVEC